MNDPAAPLSLVPTGGLVERALRLLAAGPQTTASLATELLALRGNPHLGARAIFTLLGTDPRVHVDGEGVWRLAAPAATGALPLRLQEWVVVDVETTGGSPGRGHRVIEVAAVQVGEGRVGRTFSTLVNPGRPIPRMITSLTSISNEMVAAAPRFEEIADELGTLLAGRVFVGHNAAFDWGFLNAEMERSSRRALSGRLFCTLRLARKLLPHLPSRSLGALADYFDVRMRTQHRALDDALATAHLLLRLLERVEEEAGVTDWAGVEAFIQKRPARPPRQARPRSIDAA